MHINTTWRWIAGILSAVAAIIFTVRFFSTAMPLLNLSISMDRHQAMIKAQEYAHQYQLGPSTYLQAASFETDSHTKTFIELQAGGVAKLIEVMNHHWYELYTWHVRHVQEFNHHEVSLYFTPQGSLYNFFETLSEDTVGTNVDEAIARKIGEESAQTLCHIDFTGYTLAQHARKTTPSQRIDHTFTYERTDRMLGESGLYQLTITVSGDRCTGVVHSVKVPDDFNRTYQEIRSSNNTIAWAASFFTLLILVFLCIGFGLILAFKAKYPAKKWCLIWGVGIALTQTLVFLNQLPLLWMAYNSTVSYATFLLQMMSICLVSLVMGIIQYCVIIIGAYALTRTAFTQHVPLFNYWNTRIASSIPIVWQTIGCYWAVCILIAYVVLFYLITTQFLGWWVPADALANPNILATYIPWFSAIALSVKAGFIEECVFRAAPLSCAALLGEKYGKKRIFIAIAFVIQVLIFGAAHANYPGLPAYSRIIELIVSSCVFGGIYLMYGLFPAITTHTLYDIILFSLPIFASSTSYGNQLCIILLLLVPIFMILKARWHEKQWFTSVPENNQNHNFHPSPTDPPTKRFISPQPFAYTESFSHRKTVLFCGLGVLAIAVWFFAYQTIEQPLHISISRSDAISIATKELKARSIELSDDWIPLTALYDSYMQDASQKMSNLFVWQTTNKETYTSLLADNYITPPSWRVRFVRFSGSSIERAEEYCVYIQGDGQVFRVQHTVPQSIAAPSLTEPQARALAYKELRDHYNLDKDGLEEISVESFKEPARIDWLFVFNNTITSQKLISGQARIYVIVTGDSVSDSRQFIHVPEEWVRTQMGKEHINATIILLLFLCSLFIFTYVLTRSYTHMSFRPFYNKRILACVIIALLLQYINLANALPALTAIFNTTEPYMHQLFRFMTSLLLSKSALILACISALASVTNPLELSWLSISDHGIGLACGTILAASTTVIQKFYSNNPSWPAFTGLDFYSPVYALLFSTMRTYCMCLTALLILLWLLHIYCQQSRIKTISLCVLYFVFFICTLHLTAMSGTAEATISNIFASAIGIGITFAALYRYILRHQPLILIPTVIGYTLLNALYQLYLNAIPNNIGIYTIVIGFLLITARGTLYLLRWIHGYNSSIDTM